ncbi:hypothetical protein TNCV_2740541 [Trichonephila clavipes]|nr:hypothetical protein TNCV_2740541 [Trichonephila clavipes]
MVILADVPHSVSRLLMVSLDGTGCLEGGHSSLVVKVRDSWLACHEFESGTAEDQLCRDSRCTLNLSRLKRPAVVVMRKLGEDVPAQVSSPSLDHDSKL